MILSIEDTDNVTGLVEFKAGGGHVIAQCQADADFSDIPSAAIYATSGSQGNNDVITSVRSGVASLSLSTRITLGVLMLFSLATLVQVYFISTTERSHALVDLEGRLAARSSLKAEELQRVADGLRRDVLFLASLPPVNGIIRATGKHGGAPLDLRELEAWKNQLSQTLVSFVNTNPQYYQARFIGIADGGRELIRADYVDGHAMATPQGALQQKGGRDYFKATLSLKAGEVYLSEINLNREHGKVEVPHRRTIRAATPIHTPDGNLFGMVVINMDVGPTLDMLTAGLSPDIRAYLVNDQGDYLVHPDSGRAFGFDLSRRYRWQDDVTGEQMPAVKRDADASGGMQSIFLSGEELHGVSLGVHFDSHQPQRFVTLIYAVPEVVIGGQIARTRTVAIISAFSLATLIGLLIFFYVRRTFAPLQQLTEAAEEVGGGHYDTLLPQNTGGELGTLATAFRSMQVRIGTRDREIRQINEELARSETYTNSVLDNTPEVILVVDASGCIIRTNSRAEQVFGYPRDELLGQPVEKLIPERFRANHSALRQGYVAQPAQRMMGQGRDLFGLHRDGLEIPIEVGLAPLMIGEARHVVVAIADISARKAAERALRESDNRLHLVTNSISDYAIVILDPQGRIDSWNEGARKLKGYDQEEIVGQPMDRFYTPEDISAGRPATLLKLAETEGRAEDECWRVRKDGTRFYADVIITAIRNEEGVLIGFAKITRDITQRKAAEDALRELTAVLEQRVADRTAELQAANRELESFAYAVAHDLRAPLRAMSGFSQALVEDYGEGLAPEARNYLNQIVIGSGRMGELVDGLLTLSRSTRGELRRDPVDLSALAERMLAELAKIEPERKVKWAVEPGLVARGDARMLEAVMRNLLGNAWKYTSGKPEAMIRVNIDKTGQEFLFCVSDNGAGFDMAHAGKLFQPFQRLHRQEEFAGIGIGLATVQRIVHRHGGEIYAEGIPGQGARFCFSLRDVTTDRIEKEQGTES